MPAELCCMHAYLAAVGLYLQLLGCCMHSLRAAGQPPPNSPFAQTLAASLANASVQNPVAGAQVLASAASSERRSLPSCKEGSPSSVHASADIFEPCLGQRWTGMQGKQSSGTGAELSDMCVLCAQWEARHSRRRRQLSQQPCHKAASRRRLSVLP
jgi:hypothetical protein